jgi:OmpR family two-component system sensor histidine kinase YxdK
MMVKAMNRILCMNFIKDRSLHIFIYLLNSCLLVLFFNLIHPDKLEILYPTAISLFMLTILIVAEWMRYYKFNANLLEALKDSNYNLKPLTCEQKEIDKTLTTIIEKYMRRENNIKSAYEEKTHFFSQWIHNLKTPISVIELIIQKYTPLKNMPLDAMESIWAENNRLYCSIEKVINIIRLENFEKDYEASSIELVSSLRKIINERKNQFIYNKVLPVLKTEDDKAYVISDSKWNELILEQLISNAIKYSCGGESSENIYFTITKDQKHTRLSIKDEGIGIPHYDIKRVFEAFFTGENGRKFRNSTGIGLYICKKIARKLGHEIEIKSELSKGTEVIITYLTKL